MRRIWILLGAVFLIAIALILIAGNGSGGGRTIPRFVPGTPAALGLFAWDHYNWDIPAPFKDGKVWMWTAGPGRTNNHAWLYDLDRRAILGELLNGGCPELWSPANSRLLCVGP